jgi:hypothetical protein
MSSGAGLLLPVAVSDVHRIELLTSTVENEQGRWVSVPGALIGSADGADATAITQLVAELPDGSLRRCSNPVYALRAAGSAGRSSRSLSASGVTALW